MWQYEPICDSDKTLLIFRIKDIVLSCVFNKLFEKHLCQSEYTFYGHAMELGRPLYFCPVVSSSSFFFFFFA